MPKNKPTDVFKKINMGPDDDCWEWKGTFNAKDGRPYITIEGKRRAAYVIALEAFTGEEANGRYALHQCDNKRCCNPHHLIWGTHQENMDEMKERERHGVPKTVIRAMRRLKDKGVADKEIADRYGYERSTVTKILSRHEE